MPELDVVLDVLIVIVIVKALGVVSDIFFIHFEVFLVLDVPLQVGNTPTERDKTVRRFLST